MSSKYVLLNLPERLAIEGLELRRFTYDDIELVKLLQTDPDLRAMRWAKNNPESEVVLKRFTQRWGQGKYTYAIYEHGTFCGFFSVWSYNGEEVLTASALLSEFRGNGITNRVFNSLVIPLIDFGAKRMITYIADTNAPSIRMISKRGYTRTNTFDSSGLRLYSKDLV